MSRWIKILPDKLETIKNIPGVYAIYLENKLVYIGQSLKLLTRVRYHVKVTFKKKKIVKKPFYIKVSYSKLLGDWLLREFNLLCKLNPNWNRRICDYFEYRSLYLNEDNILVYKEIDKIKYKELCYTKIFELKKEGFSDFLIATYMNQYMKKSCKYTSNSIHRILVKLNYKYFNLNKEVTSLYKSLINK